MRTPFITQRGIAWIAALRRRSIALSQISSVGLQRSSIGLSRERARRSSRRLRLLRSRSSGEVLMYLAQASLEQECLRSSNASTPALRGGREADGDPATMDVSRGSSRLSCAVGAICLLLTLGCRSEVTVGKRSDAVCGVPCPQEDCGNAPEAKALCEDGVSRSGVFCL